MAAYLAPSILSADLSDIRSLAHTLETWGVDYIHLDVMDGVFVPNFTFGISIVRAFRRSTRLPLDVHLMMVRPENYIDRFIDAGASILTVHYEASPHLHRTLTRIRQAGAKAGVALNPHTPVSALETAVRWADVVLLMSVSPGFGGQTFIPETFEKIRQLQQLAHRKNPDLLIGVDGGVGPDNAPRLIQAGAHILVVGNAIFGAPQPATTVRQLQQLLRN